MCVYQERSTWSLCAIRTFTCHVLLLLLGVQSEGTTAQIVSLCTPTSLLQPPPAKEINKKKTKKKTQVQLNAPLSQKTRKKTSTGASEARHVFITVQLGNKGGWCVCACVCVNASGQRHNTHTHFYISSCVTIRFKKKKNTKPLKKRKKSKSTFWPQPPLRHSPHTHIHTNLS